MTIGNLIYRQSKAIPECYVCGSGPELPSERREIILIYEPSGFGFLRSLSRSSNPPSTHEPPQMQPRQASQHHLHTDPCTVICFDHDAQRSCAHDLSSKMSLPARSWEQG